MSTKALTPDQCAYLHQKFPPPECCICNARIELEEVKRQLSELQVKYDELSAFVKAMGIPK